MSTNQVVDSLRRQLAEPVELPELKDGNGPTLSNHRSYNQGWNAYAKAVHKLGPLYTYPAIHPEPVAIVTATGGPHDTEDRVLVELQAELPPVGTKLYAHPADVSTLVALLRECAVEFNTAEASAFEVEMRRKIDAALAYSAEPSTPVERDERAEWVPVFGPGQIKIGDWLSFSVARKHFCARAKEILNPGSEKEEVIYNRKKNHYFITAMAVAGTSSHKGVMQARAALDKATEGAKP